VFFILFCISNYRFLHIFKPCLFYLLSDGADNGKVQGKHFHAQLAYRIHSMRLFVFLSIFKTV